MVKEQISLREANQHLSKYIEAVVHGSEVIITRRGKPVARLMPVETERRLTTTQRAAWKRTQARMRKGFALGGKRFDRESAHER